MKKKIKLTEKFRPKKFSTIIGNKTILKGIEAIIKDEDRPSTYLLEGPSGCGKTTISKIMPRMLGINKRDVYEYNISNQRGIDNARNIIESVHISAFGGDTGKCIILNECHRATGDFQNAMLEVLEDPPEHVYFILCTTEPTKLLSTIITRCTRFKVRPLTVRESLKLLNRVSKREKADVPRDVIKKIIDNSMGSARQMIVDLGKVIKLSDKKEMLQLLDTAYSDEKTVITLSQALLRKDNWAKVRKIVSKLGEDPEDVRHKVQDYMGKVLLDKGSLRASEIITEFSEPFYQKSLLINACFTLTLSED